MCALKKKKKKSACCCRHLAVEYIDAHDLNGNVFLIATKTQVNQRWLSWEAKKKERKIKINNNSKGYGSRLITEECPDTFFGIKSAKSRFYLMRKSLLGARLCAVETRDF